MSLQQSGSPKPRSDLSPSQQTAFNVAIWLFMRRNIASAVGAEVRELDEVVQHMIAENSIHQEAATRILARMRQSR